MPDVILLDGAIGTMLEARGLVLPAPMWSAWAVEHDPDAISALHAAYAEAGADVHTAATFRTTPRGSGAAWRELLGRAVALAKPYGRVAGSIAPLEDCWHPERSPADPGPELRAIARALADAGADLLLCETFANVREAQVAVAAAVDTGLPTWVSFTPGFRGDLLTPREVEAAAREAVRHGAAAVLVNCTPADRTLAYVERLADLGVPCGAYANALHDPDVRRYGDYAQSWIDQGAVVIGGCCGTGPEHIAELQRRRKA